MLKNIKKVILHANDDGKDVRYYKLDDNMWLAIIDGVIKTITMLDEDVLDTLEIWQMASEDNDITITLA